MNQHRDSLLLALRPAIPAAVVHDNMSAEEQFQNETLRPILKFLHPILIEVCRQYISRKKNVFYDLPPDRQINYIAEILFKDTQIKIEFRGMAIGQFTVEEYQVYRQYDAAINKRILSMVKERLLSSVSEIVGT